MNPHRTHKKNLIVSYKNLSDGLKQLFKETYPDGYSDYLQRFEKPNGDTIFVVPMETEDTVYMIKFDVKIDTTITDADADDDKDYFDEEIEKADHEFVPLSEAIEKEENSNAHTERSIRHGDYEEAASDKKRKGSLSSLGKELEEAFDNDEYAEDEYAEKEEAPENEPAWKPSRLLPLPNPSVAVLARIPLLLPRCPPLPRRKAVLARTPPQMTYKTNLGIPIFIL